MLYISSSDFSYAHAYFRLTLKAKNHPLRSYGFSVWPTARYTCIPKERKSPVDDVLVDGFIDCLSRFPRLGGLAILGIDEAQRVYFNLKIFMDPARNKPPTAYPPAGS
ncbi:hypothetical protein GALMADRAFT_704927 [Galerina marginata CBS 339.88]|uniref:Uncharacterized protein n=1 Tax=Galerina marginata (strain CBS 339.88) TaxID=685588 RepID=A0A067TM02_GALM3|nr:hypothetical protein GALMADRAFT_704927 [Galerina marginata CBS 339.88]